MQTLLLMRNPVFLFKTIFMPISKSCFLLELVSTKKRVFSRNHRNVVFPNELDFYLDLRLDTFYLIRFATLAFASQRQYLAQHSAFAIGVLTLI